MSGPITVPGDIPGLLREGAPIAVRFESPPCEIRGTVLRNGDIACRDGGHSDIYEIGDHQDADFTASQLVVILSEPAGRDIAARWVAERLGLEVGLTAPAFFFDGGRQEWLLVVYREMGGCNRWRFSAADWFPDMFNETGVPGLPMDRTKGAEAMRMIILALAGRLP